MESASDDGGVSVPKARNGDTMTTTEIIDYIDEFLAENEAFVSPTIVDFALDMRSFITSMEAGQELIEAA